MATETRSRFNNYIAPGLFAVAKENFKRYADTWKEFYSMRTSKRSYEESGYTSGFGYLVQKPEGTAHQPDARIQGPVKRWVHDTWSLLCRISEEAIEDVMYGIMKTAMKDLGVSGQATRHLLAIRMMMNATSTTYHTVGDNSTAVASQSHSRLGGGTYSNLGDAADPNEPALEAAIKNFESIVDHRGKKYDQKAEYVWCGPTHEFKFSKLLHSQLEPETSNNAINAIPRRRKLQLKIDAEITDGRWGVGGRKDEDIGMIWFDRVKPTLSRYGDPDTGDAMFVIRGRWSNEVNDPRQMYFIPPFS